MAGRFQRTITFPSPRPDASCTTVATKRSSYRTRSSSLPVRFHPIISNLDDDVASLRSWSESRSSPQAGSSTFLLVGVDLISVVLASLSDLLSHPQAADPLRNSPITDPYLDDLMRLADSYDLFRISLINLSHLQGETQAALRRWDSARLASAVRAQRKASKDIIRIATRAKAAAKTKPPPPPLEASVSLDSTGVIILPVVFCDATFALAAASAELISGLAVLSNEATSPIAPVVSTGGPVKLLKIWWIVDLMRWKSRARRRAMERKKEGGMERSMERKVATEKLEGLKKCIIALESGSEKVFRALVNARVTVLNILTPSI
ncbi:hypothetical protein FCM35_KLT16063 [Carex littledalei]|uniref:Uncharacterized protein n=1 Tax=Carex littledalei TaxID=544730 RepID=A0A833RFV4_9POAL|nr:hypothetical protein FCM35_KLT16063 [Carex littledalei]